MRARQARAPCRTRPRPACSRAQTRAERGTTGRMRILGGVEGPWGISPSGTGVFRLTQLQPLAHLRTIVARSIGGSNDGSHAQKLRSTRRNARAVDATFAADNGTRARIRA